MNKTARQRANAPGHGRTTGRFDMHERTCKRCGTPLPAWMRRNARYCPAPANCQRKAESARGRANGRPWATGKARWTPSFDLRDGTIVDHLGSVDIGRHNNHLTRDPCAYCNAPSQVLDHIVPNAVGGPNDWTNRAAACADCNGAKSDKTLLAFLLMRHADHDLALLTERRARIAEIGPPTLPKDKRPPHRPIGRLRNR